MEDQTNPCFKRKVLGKLPWTAVRIRYCWWFRNPAKVDSLSHYLQGFLHPVVWDFWTINSTTRRLRFWSLAASCKPTQRKHPKTAASPDDAKLSLEFRLSVDPLEFLTVIHKLLLNSQGAPVEKNPNPKGSGSGATLASSLNWPCHDHKVQPIHPNLEENESQNDHLGFSSFSERPCHHTKSGHEFPGISFLIFPSEKNLDFFTYNHAAKKKLP